ncbi:MAG: ATPase [Firmicutes bacterium]|nr:ATPase [Bacillota bacterium]MBQ7241631.1 ATPase [Bacillota bacterium]MBR0105117.1 ATPase [Bacillota bacterium]
MDSVLKLLDELEEIIDESRSVPFSSGKISVNKDDILEIITDIRNKLPNEIKQSKWILEERNKILADSEREAEDIIKKAEEHMNQLIDEHEVTKKAYENADEIVAKSRQDSKTMRIGAVEYTDGILMDTQDRLKELQHSVAEQQNILNEFINQSLDILYENRQQLKSMNEQK